MTEGPLQQYKETAKSKVRINKYLADAGLGSRRKCDSLIQKGLVSINGVRAKNGDKVLPGIDRIEVQGQSVSPQEQYLYLMLNKPVGYVTTSSDELGRKIILDLVPGEYKKKRVYSAGRLDRDSRGLIILTNDGPLAHKIIHPKHHLSKEYMVKIIGQVNDNIIRQLSSGIDIGDHITFPAKVEHIKKYNSGETLLRFVLSEGKHRQIRRMCQRVGLEVVDLQRTRIGPLELTDLPEGRVRPLSDEELSNLRNAVDPGTQTQPAIHNI